MKKLVMLSAMLMAASALAQEDAEFDCANTSVQWQLNECEAQAWQEADEQLNAQYQESRRVMKAWDADASDLAGAEEALVRAQRAWVAFRDAQCTFRGYQARGGTMESMLIYGCQAELTRQRTQQLKEQTDLMGGN